MKSFHNLQIWNKSHQLNLDLYKVTKSFSKEELYGLTSQIRRAVASIPTNIAEGCGRAGDADFRRFLIIAMGSASELEYLLLLARDLNFLAPEHYHKFFERLEEVKKMLASLIKKLKADR